MIVLFLDIDGVCNSAEYAKRRNKGGMLGIDPILANRVKNIIARTDCKVVLSSVWRLREDDRETVRREVCDFIDVTPDFRGKYRGDEVKDWLDRHPEVKRYAILDDDSDFLQGQKLFKTSFSTGLTEEIMDKVIEHFRGFR